MIPILTGWCLPRVCRYPLQPWRQPSHFQRLSLLGIISQFVFERRSATLQTIETGNGINLVAIGGGTGLSTLLAGLKKLVGGHERERNWIETLSAIVTVSDDGGSSGRLREELQMLPPGDIRNCMIA